MSANGKWCRHFAGIAYGPTCKAGIEYNNVRVEKPGQGFNWPCVDPELAYLCSSYEPWTAKEIAAEKTKLAAWLENMEAFTRGDHRQCIHCGELVTHVQKVGRSAYAEPCGCRLWQGDPPKWAQD